MGTMGYMSPEQVRGLPVDHRSDIFSFGAILYEMLSGKKAFKRDTASDTIAAILKEEPPELTQSGRNVSPALDHIVKHCLEKDREQPVPVREGRRVRAVGGVVADDERSSGVHARARRDAGRKKTLDRRRRRRRRPRRRRASSSATADDRRRGPRPAASSASRSCRSRTWARPRTTTSPTASRTQIRGKLTSLPGLQVIARGSSTPYKKTTKTPKQIAEELERRATC